MKRWPVGGSTSSERATSVSFFKVGCNALVAPVLLRWPGLIAAHLDCRALSHPRRAGEVEEGIRPGEGDAQIRPPLPSMNVLPPT